MEKSLHPALVWLRAVVLASICAIAGSVAHLSGGGRLPGAAGLLILLGGLTLGSASLLCRPASRRRLVVMVVAGQSLVHMFLAATAGHVGDPVRASAVVPPITPVPSGPRVGSLFDQYAALGSDGTGFVVPGWLVHMGAELTGPGAFMGLAHLGAAVLVGLWLARGESALWALLALLASAVVRLVRCATAPEVRVQRLRTQRGGADLARLVDSVRTTSISRRGPPARVLVTV